MHKCIANKYFQLNPVITDKNITHPYTVLIEGKKN